MDRLNSLNKFKKARTALIVAIVFAAINCVLGYIFNGLNLMYTVALPQIAISLLSYFAEMGYPLVAVVLVYCILPLFLFTLCYIKSRNNNKWLLVATILYGIDVVIVLVLWAQTQFDMGMVFDFIFEAYIFYLLIDGVKAGKTLNGDFTEETPKTMMDIYEYNQDYAKAHKADKTKYFIIYWGCFLVVGIGSLLAVSYLNASENEILVLISLLVACGIMAFLFLRVMKVLPFVNSKNYVYYRVGNTLYRSFDGGSTMIDAYENIKIAKEKEDCFECVYSRNGKEKKLIIPKAYNNIEQILK